VAEVATLDFQSRPQRGHVCDHLGRVLGGQCGIDVLAQAKIVIAPDADDACIGQQSTSLRQPIVHGDHIAEAHDLIDAQRSEPVERQAQGVDVLVNVGDQTELHDNGT
jgi:hypothetical protein